MLRLDGRPALGIHPQLNFRPLLSAILEATYFFHLGGVNSPEVPRPAFVLPETG